MKLRLLKLATVTLLFASSAFADTCAKSLMPTFTADQAKVLCQKYPDALGDSFVPQTNAVSDLGSAAAAWRNGFFTSTVSLAGLKTPVANEEAVEGAGTTTSDAAVLSATKHIHELTGANGTVGWKFNSPGVGSVEILLNTTAGVAKIYAETGGTVNGGSVDAAFSALTGVKPIICYCTATATWICS